MSCWKCANCYRTNLLSEATCSRCGDPRRRPVDIARTNLKRAITRLIKAEIASSWKGGGDPADEPAIEQERTRAREAVDRAIYRLEIAT